MKKLTRSLAVLAVAMLAVSFLATPAFADDDHDPPGRVARLKYMSGQVSFQPGGVNDWVEATLNRPLTTADRVWTDKGAKAELTTGTAAIRMSSETSLTFTNLNDNTIQVELDQGVLNLHVRKMYPGEVYEIDTPNVAFTLLKAGDYRFEVDADRDTTQVIVRKGKGEGNGDGRGVEVESGEMARFEHGNTLMHAIERAPGLDGFDDWCRVRDQREDRSYESARYVSDDVIGHEDLDDYGYWRPVPTYGYVWVPRHVVVGWAPYRYGHWAWVEPWGWTWVDDAPWGFAPFHYGRWVYSPYGWGWCPGPRHYRPVYAPALVAWFGGSHWGVGVSFGNVGWVPLGWGEPYYPHYRVSNTYVRNVNITNTHITNITYVTNNYNTIINNHGKPIDHHERYMNERGVSMVPGDAMVHGQRVDRVVQPWRGDLNKAQFTPTPGVTPDRSTVLGGKQPIHGPQNLSDRRPVISKLTPPERPSDFDSRRPLIEKNGGMPVDRNLGERGRRIPDERKPVMADEGNRGPRGGNRVDPTAAPPRVPDSRRPVETNEPMVGERSGGHAVPRPPDDRKPVMADEGNRGPRGGNRVDPTAPPPRVPDSRKPVETNEPTVGERTGGHAVPRPPDDRKPGSDSPSAREAVNDSGNHAVPRPPADRKPVITEEDRKAGEGNPQHANPTVPQERRRETDAEARPQAAPRPDHEVKPPAEKRQEERRNPKREEAPKPQPSEREAKPTPTTPTGFAARSNRVPRPTAAPAHAYVASSRSDDRSNSYRQQAYRTASYGSSARSSYRSTAPTQRSYNSYRSASYSSRGGGSGREANHAASSSARSSGGSTAHSNGEWGRGR